MLEVCSKRTLHSDLYPFYSHLISSIDQWLVNNFVFCHQNTTIIAQRFPCCFIVLFYFLFKTNKPLPILECQREASSSVERAKKSVETNLVAEENHLKTNKNLKQTLQTVRYDSTKSIFQSLFNSVCVLCHCLQGKEASEKRH